MNAKTINDLIIVEDNIVPETLFAMKKDDNTKPIIYKYVRIDSLPEDIKQIVRDYLLSE